jgi:hypothetical protein
MIPRMRFVLVVCVVAACGEDLPIDTARSDARLKLARIEFVDGFETWASVSTGEPDLFDIELGGPCVPRRWSDGVLRCTPGATVVYLDAECSSPHLENPAVRYAVDSAELPTELFLGTAEFVRADVLFERRDGQCIQTERSSNSVVRATPRPVYELAELETVSLGEDPYVVTTLRSRDGLLVPLGLRDTRDGATCDLDALEGASGGACSPAAPCELTRGPRAAGEFRLQPIYVEHGASRIRGPNQLFDTVLETECELQPIGLRARCRPRSGRLILGFSDPACTTSLPTLAGVSAESDACGERAAPKFLDAGARFFPIGPLHAGEVYELVEGVCLPVAGAIHDLGEPLPEEHLLISDVIRRDP